MSELKELTFSRVILFERFLDLLEKGLTENPLDVSGVTAYLQVVLKALTGFLEHHRIYGNNLGNADLRSKLEAHLLRIPGILELYISKEVIIPTSADYHYSRVTGVLHAVKTLFEVSSLDTANLPVLPSED